MDLATRVPGKLKKADELDSVSHLRRTYEIPDEPDPDEYEPVLDKLTLSEVEHLLIKFCLREVGGKEEMYFNPDAIMHIDNNIDYKVYIIGSSVYDRRTIYETYPLVRLNIQPEQYCSRLYLDEIIEYDVKRNKDGTPRIIGTGVKISKRPYIDENSIPTKIFVGNHKWKDLEVISSATSMVLDKTEPLTIVKVKEILNTKETLDIKILE